MASNVDILQRLNFLNSDIHIVSEKTYFKPTYCDICSKLLMGIVHQGVQCESMTANTLNNILHKISLFFCFKIAKKIFTEFVIKGNRRYVCEKKSFGKDI